LERKKQRVKKRGESQRVGSATDHVSNLLISMVGMTPHSHNRDVLLPTPKTDPHGYFRLMRLKLNV